MVIKLLSEIRDGFAIHILWHALMLYCLDGTKFASFKVWLHADTRHTPAHMHVAAFGLVYHCMQLYVHLNGNL